MFSIVIGSDKYTVFDIENDMEKHVSYSNVNRSGLEDFGLDQDNLLSIKSLNGFNLNKVYIQLSEKNDIRKNNT